jgi:hypothetical protein
MILKAVIKVQKYRADLKYGISGLSRDMLEVVGYGVYIGQKFWKWSPLSSALVGEETNSNSKPVYK